jgi:hypothetical protein
MALPLATLATSAKEQHATATVLFIVLPFIVLIFMGGAVHELGTGQPELLLRLDSSGVVETLPLGTEHLTSVHQASFVGPPAGPCRPT